MAEKKKIKIRLRWVFIGFILLQVVFAFVFPPVRPEIQLQPDHFSETPLFNLPVLGEVYLTDTMIAMLLVDLIVGIIAWVVSRAVESGKLILDGFAGLVEAAIDAMYDLTESTVSGKWAKEIFPIFVSITFVVLIANWMELIPGVDSIGLIKARPEGGIVKQFGPLAFLLKGEVEGGTSYHVVPFVRALATDLNFTLGLALFSIVMTQVMGVRAQGMAYFTKFFNFKQFSKNPFMGGIDFGVGLLELVSEFSKIISFTFRLFGNIFAGSVMLFVIGTLLPVLVQSAFLGLEVFVGVIQAIVFGMLTMVFMAQAVQGHHTEEE